MGTTRFVRFGRLAAILVVAASCTATSGTVRGLVLDVEGTLTEVTAFTLLVEGERLRFLPLDDGDYAFPLPHLQEHRRTGEPVLVGWELKAGNRLAVTLDDG